MRLDYVLKRIQKDLEESDHFFESEIEIIIEILRVRLKRYDTKKKSKKKKPKKVEVKDSWFVS